MFLSVIHIWNMLHLQQLKGKQSLNLGMWRASPYKTLLTTQPPHPGLPILGDPRDSQLDLEKMLGRESYCTAHKCLIRFFLSDYLSVFHCVMGLRLNLSLAEIWRKWYFLYLLRNWHYRSHEPFQPQRDKAQIGHAQFYPCSPLPWESFQVSNKMPDYLGKDQRKIKDDEKKDDKPIQGASDTLNHTKSRRDLLVTRLTSFSLRLHMETRIQIFH